MNYRHHFHAGNFADVMKHVLLVQLLRALQKKDKGFLYLDTHAGRGRYDLTLAASGDTLARKPEWPEGIGRLWTRQDVPAAVADYLSVVRSGDKASATQAAPKFYPGSPWIAAACLREQDRMALCERQPDECEILRRELGFARRASIQEMDGYIALRAMLPPPERRALVLIDPPFEAQDEFAQVTRAVAEGLNRFPSGVFALWYPLTERARVDEFLDALCQLNPPPTLVAELAIAGEQAPIRLRGCGLVVINPPWQFDAEAKPTLDFLADTLAQAPGAVGRTQWIVAER